MSARIFETPAALIGSAGETLGPSEWVTIEQDRIDQFAQATDDHQWIHVDPVKAKDGPFGATIAHGYLTMSLVNRFLPELIEVQGASMGINVGTDKLRFLTPVKVGSRIRGVGEIVSAEEAKGGYQVVVRVTVEIDGEAKPACVVDTISRFFP
ncbi:MaoC family dehydratase [Sphingomonas montanisoli]|uniref:MaoC family dehydratase n=1 Tax=Sphingomonas montanisoli TaxID=2606412 RepID=A0A5D9CEE8_9SPHN|nr:MaoC family dehydratase [Sphingomonas montanisoli]TZG29360.1 MaoC family dehydratase [Sphingomonas montanisoli]